MARNIKKLSRSMEQTLEDQRRKQDGLLRASLDFKKVLEGAKLGALFLDRDLSIWKYTATVEKWFRMTLKDCGQPIARLKRRLGYDKVEEDAKKVLLSHKPIERDLRTKSGKSFIVQMSPYYIRRSKINGVIITFTDITARKKTEDMLLKMVDAAPNATIAVNEDGVIVRISIQLEKLFGYNRQNLIGNPIQILIPERFRRIHPHHQRRYFLDPKVRPMGAGLQLFGRRSDGSEFPVDISLSPLKTPDGTLAIVALKDITERVKAESKLRELNTRLVDAEQKEQERISQLLHDDLQQRLFAIKTQFSALDNAYAEKDWEGLHQALTPMERWLTETISITRNLSMDLYPAVPHSENLVDSLTTLSAQMNKQYSLDVALKADSIKDSFNENLNLMLIQVVRELLFNVVKHSETLQASLTVEEFEGELSITVSDQGKGFDSVTVLNTPSGAHGLITIQNRLDLMGCQMEVISKIGVGTQVVIRCPSSG